jgi:hypothetical protein
MATAARARTTHRRAASTAPRHHRRVSGPLRPVTAHAPGVAIPRTRTRQRTTAFERIRALPEHRIVDSLLRSRAWIVVVAALLGGIVAMQVSLLKLNSGISRAVETSATLERQNADMQDTIARLSSGERVRAAALNAGMVSPPAGDIGFLRARGARTDAAIAAQHMQPPSDTARLVMSNGGTDPNAVVAAPTPTPTPLPQG